MTATDAVRAIRGSVAVTRLDDVRYARLAGAGAREAVLRLCPANLYLRDGQLLQALLLEDDGRVFADCYVGRDDEDYFLLADGPSAMEFNGWIARHLADYPDVTWTDLSPGAGFLSLDGPYAWELLGAVAGAECIGLPYLTFFHHGDWLIARAGRTGEYGYLLVVPAAEADAVQARFLEAGAALDAAPGNRAALEQCALENWFFSIRREGREAVTPLELQLQWRLSLREGFVGSEALSRRRAEGVRERLTCFVGAGPYTAGDGLWLGGTRVGRVVAAAASETRGDWVGLALIDIVWAHPGIDFRSGDGVPARSVTPPVIDNRSLHVSPQLHSYATRGDDTFPPLPRTSP